MQDFDKWPQSLQWVIGAGVFIGGILAAWFGSRSARQPDHDHDQFERERDSEIDRLRDQLRDNELKQECHLMVGQAQEAMGDAIKATRESFHGEIEKMQQHIDRLERRLHDVEIGRAHRR